MKPQDLQTLARAALMPTTTPAPTAAQAIAAKVDELGQLHAAIADMKRKADQLRAELEDAGLDNIEGQLYRVNFAAVAGRTLTDWKTIAERLKASRQMIAAHTTTGEASTRMTVKARQTH
jgi:histidinol-phosphate/aromatic aminotransferase/cobyric acid decarboxylase-like protein